ncbi:MAG: M20/M25/M40 family metallo-hydrolase [Lentisphaeria bacterium]|nr:M20/M25/M40 family metallo-hydrolase [Lentisphaeria bacterium]
MQTYIELLKELIRQRPVSRDAQAVNRAQELVYAFLKERGLYCTFEEMGEKKLLFASTVPGKTPALLLNAHLDVVPADHESQYSPRQEGEWIIGRGPADCLGNAVAVIKALCESKEASVGAIFSGDEEIGGKLTAEMARRGYSASRLIVIMDFYGNGNICCAQKGILNLKLTARGVSGHSSAPHLCDNAIDKLLSGYSRLKALWQNPSTDDLWHKTMAATVIHAGLAANQIPEMAEMTLNFRTVAPQEQEEIIDLVRQTTGLEVTVISSRPPVTVSTDAPEIKLFAACMEKHLGRKPDFTRMSGATDASCFASSGIPIAIAGIRGMGEHSPEEKADMGSLEKYAQILVELAQKLS